MAVSIQVVGADSLRVLARDLKKAGDKDLRKELYSGLNRATKPLEEAARRSAAGNLPSSGGRVRKRRTKKGTVTIYGVDYFTRKTVSLKTTKASGSVADRAAAMRFSVKSRAGRNPAVTVVAVDRKGKSVDLNELDQGRLKHPVYGNRKVWVTQPVKAGWWTDALNAAPVLNDVREEVVRVIGTVAAKLSLGGK